MTVYRIHIRPSGGANDPELSFQYCWDHGVLGMGWSVEETGKFRLTWDEYAAAAANQYGPSGFQNPCYMHNNVEENDLIWTRDTMGCYYLGRVVGPWEYLAPPEALQADIVNICHCELEAVPADAVPGKVVASFRAGRTIQAIRNPPMMTTYSQLRWNEISGTQQYAVNPQGIADIYALLDDQETENAVAIYLQMRGWLYIPGSRRPYTMGYEYILIHRQTFERAVVQVKTGDTTQLNRDDYAGFEERVFLFQSYGNYNGAMYNHVECIDPDELQEFLFNNRNILPQSIRLWVDFLEPPPIP